MPSDRRQYRRGETYAHGENKEPVFGVYDVALALRPVSRRQRRNFIPWWLAARPKDS